MSPEHSAGHLRQETVSSQHLPVGDQSLTTESAGAQTVQEKQGWGGNIYFLQEWVVVECPSHALT